MNVEIQEAAESHLDLVVGLLTQLHDVMERSTDIDRAEIEANLRSLLNDPARRILVASSGAEVAGVLIFGVRRTALHPRPSALIDELVVDAAWRGFGIGRKLVEAAIDQAHRMGCCEIEVSTERSNQTARKFYAECGFDEESVLLERDLL